MNDDVKMVIVARDKYPDGNGGTMSPRKGKLIAQGAHAASHFLIQKVAQDGSWNKVEKEWLETGTKKIAVRADTEEQLLDIAQRASAAGLYVHVVTDSGLTEFNGVPTKTCLAIGPDRSSKIDKITGELKLL